MIDMSDLEELNKKLDKKLAELDRKEEQRSDASRNVPLDELLTPAFVSQHTRFADVEELFAASGFDIGSQTDFESVPEEKWNAFIRSVSDFADWEAMLGAAGGEWAAHKLDM
ncbi:MAG TPA: hypothetical protein VJ961_00055 [Mariprofundaceae bacterium]|nr:hypothetical protein [Mariprofundaceae bacterium]